ncbi:peptide chain release factor 2 [Clostridia bacterium]|nr:peptide chain release factor 2 [Clostridia bacterium]
MVFILEFAEIKLKLEEIDTTLKNLKEALKINDLEREIASLESRATKPNFWSHSENPQKILSEVSRLKNKISSYKNLKIQYTELCLLVNLSDNDEDLSLLGDIKFECKKISDKLESELLTTFFSGEFDSNNAILTLHAGAGGTESQDWVEMLYRMYFRFSEKNGYRVKMLDFLDGEEAGFKSISALIEGVNAYGYLKSEVGVHRLVRISPFDSSGRRHTSFASVEVIPEIENDIAIEISPDDLKTDVFRASGAGGQNVNKTSTAVRITHIPTGIVVACQNERSQIQNREIAIKMLKSKLVEIKEREHLEKIEDIKGVQKEIAWGSQIRSYVFMPYTMVKDHRSGFEIGNVASVMDGNIESFIFAYLKSL